MAVMRLLQTPEHAAYLPDYRSCSNMIHLPAGHIRRSCPAQ
jgi:hypothetical protein